MKANQSHDFSTPPAPKAEAAVTDAMASLIKAAREITEDYPKGKDWRMKSGRGYAVATGYVDDLRTALVAIDAALSQGSRE